MVDQWFNNDTEEILLFACALQIFKLESHPSGFKAETAREGFSVYGILNRCKSKAGSQMLRQWFRHPLLDIRRLNERYDTIEFFINPRNIEVTSSLEACLKNIKHIARVLGRMMQAEASLGDWHALYKTVYNAINIGDICRSQSSEIAIFTKIGHTFSEGLHKVANLISKIVDFEESTVSGRFVVKPHVNATLDEKKRMYNGLPDLMTKVAQEEMKNMSDDITECAVVYLPQLGYLLALSPTERMNRLQDYSLPGMQFMFLSSNKVHYKTASTRKLDSQLGDTHCDIMDLETEIMHRLQNSILQESTLLLDVVQFAAELDCLIALANCARENNYCRPQLSDSNVILIRAGRHPLQELCCSETQFVPNDTDSGPDGGRVKLLTGTNASGKSVYLKQVGLIVFMAQVGSFVPAEAAVIGVVDKIFTRMRTMESISLNLSAFAIDLSQVSAAVRYATERSLIILDEFGKGTEMEDGAALLCACLKYWLARADSCPHIFVSTHFHGIIQQKLLPSSAQLRYQTMDVLEDDGQLVFLYQLIEGVTNSSHALHVGLKAGIPQDILDRAAQVEDLRHRNLPVGRLQRSATQNELKRCEAAATRFLQLDLNNDNLTDFLGTCTARQ